MVHSGESASHLVLSKSDGRSSIHVLAGKYVTSLPLLRAFDTFLDTPTSFLNAHRPTSQTFSSIVDTKPSHAHLDKEARPSHLPNPFFTFLTIFSTPRAEWEIDSLPYNLRIFRDQVYSDDIFDMRLKECGTYAPLHAKYGVDVEEGAVVVVRPDGYVGAVVELTEDGFEAINAYFAGFMISRK